MAVTKRVSISDEDLIQQYKDDYARAKAAGDKAGMEQAHANAEAVRKKYGYSGGADGSEYIPKLKGVVTTSSKKDKSSTSKSPAYVETEKPTFDMDDIGTRPTFDMNSIGTRPTYDWQEILGEKPTYTSQYDTQIDALLNEILNREKFSYDAETDPVYQQYKTMYNREGTRAMNDTLAAVASSWGAAVLP